MRDVSAPTKEARRVGGYQDLVQSAQSQLRWQSRDAGSLGAEATARGIDVVIKAWDSTDVKNASMRIWAAMETCRERRDEVDFSASCGTELQHEVSQLGGKGFCEVLTRAKGEVNSNLTHSHD